MLRWLPVSWILTAGKECFITFMKDDIGILIGIHPVPNSNIDLFRASHPITTPRPISSTFEGISNFFKALQFLNTSLPIVSIPFERLTVSKDSQPENVQDLSALTLMGMVMLDKVEQPENAFSPISSTVAGILNRCNALQFRTRYIRYSSALVFQAS